MPYQPFDLSGKVVLVTGGNGGIGLGMADACAAAGADVAIWGTNEGKNTEAASHLGRHGTRIEATRVDVSDEAAVTEGMRALQAAFGRLDACFANAGIGIAAKSFLEMSTESYRKVLSVNLDGVFFTLREAARLMVERAQAGEPGGSLVGIASLAAIEGAARNQHYAATKGAVVSMIKACAVEFGRHHIRANAILPGWIATDMTRAAQGIQVFADKVITRVPIRRWGEPDDFGGVAVYLASDASRYHSGDLLVVDGGYAVF